MEQVKSWARRDGIPSLIGSKHVDWSIFEYGTTIPYGFHDKFFEANGEVLADGDRRPVTLLVEDQEYSATLLMDDRPDAKNGWLQLRYDGNKELKALLRDRFRLTYEYLNEERAYRKAEDRQKVFVRTGEGRAEFLDFFATDQPYRYRVECRTLTAAPWTPPTFEQVWSDLRTMIEDGCEVLTLRDQATNRLRWVDDGIEVSTDKGTRTVPQAVFREVWKALLEHRSLPAKDFPGAAEYYSTAVSSILARLPYVDHLVKPKITLLLREPSRTDPKQGEALLITKAEEGSTFTPNLDLASITAHFSEALTGSHIHFGPRHEERVRAFIAALATKRLVILTGLSGSGKTQIALRFGQWLGDDRYTIIPVRPDWTGSEALFGYEDALGAATPDGRSTWHAPEALRFMLRAAADPTHPYLLILDEMNLAHVERYFADVLSGMESGEACLPNLRQEADGRWRPIPGAAEKIPVPANLFIVGTVNVDETTYMFSPKVLDRANTFEFRVETEDLSLTARKPVDCAPAAPEDVAGFLAIATEDEFQVAHPAPDLDLFTEHLRMAHRLLTEGGFEFGHRVFYEAIRFAAMLNAAGNPDPLDALDLQVMQKLLPRLHGTRRRLEPTLNALTRFCTDLTFDSGSIEAGSAATVLGSEQPQLPRSLDKLRRMMRSLKANQFTSFTE